MALAPTQIAPTADVPATDMSPGQQRTAKQVQFDPTKPVGSPGNPRFEGPQTSAYDRAGIAPGDVTIDRKDGKPRVGPYDVESGDLTDDFTKRVESQQAAQEEEDWKEIEREAAAEAEAKDPNAPMGAKEYFAPVGAVMGDLARTVAEAAPATVIGLKKGFNSFVDLAEEISGGIDDLTGMGSWKTPTIVLDGDKKTPVFDFQSRDEVRESGQLEKIQKAFSFDADKLKTAEDKIDSVGGNFIKSASQFATGWAVGGKTLKGIKTVGGAGGFVKALAQGAIADFSAFDAQEGNLSKMLNDMAPEFRNPVTDFLANDEETPELLGRAKNALEGAGLGAALDLTINGLRAMKALRKAKAEVSSEAKAQGYQIDPAAGPEIAEKASAKLERDVAAALKPAVKPRAQKVVAANDSAPEIPRNEFSDQSISDLEQTVDGQAAGGAYDEAAWSIPETDVARVRAMPETDRAAHIQKTLDELAARGVYNESLDLELRSGQRLEDGTDVGIANITDPEILRLSDELWAAQFDKAGNRTVPVAEFNRMASEAWERGRGATSDVPLDSFRKLGGEGVEPDKVANESLLASLKRKVQRTLGAKKLDAAGKALKGVDAKELAEDLVGTSPEAAARVVAAKTQLDEAEKALADAQKPEALVGEIVDGAPAVDQPYGKGELWRASPDELEQMLADKKLGDDDAVLKAFDGDKEMAAEFKRLERGRNSADPKRADAASAEFDAKFDNLTPKQERLIYGIGETDAQVDDIEQLLKAHQMILPGDEKGWIEYMGATGARVLNADNIARVLAGEGSAYEQAAFLKVRLAFEAGKQAGTDPNTLIQDMTAALVSRGGWTPEQASEVMGAFASDMAAGQRGAPKALPNPEDMSLFERRQVEKAEQEKAERLAGAQAKVDEARAEFDLATAGAKADEQVPNVFDLPMHRMNTPEDVQRVILKMAERNAVDIDGARRGVQTWADTAEKSRAIDAMESMARRKMGDAANAETITAYSQAFIASMEKLTQLADSLKADPTNLAKQIALRRAHTITLAIKMEFMGARAELGRAMNALKQMGGDNPYRGLDLETQLREAGGAEGALELADLILKMKAKKGHAFDMVSPADHLKSSLKTIYVNGLLSGFGTPIANVAGSLINVMQDTMTRIVAESAGKGLGGTEFESGETMAMITGYLGGMRDAWRLRPAEAFPEGVTRGLREDSGSMGYVDPRKDRPLSAAAFQVDEASALGRVLNVLDVTVRAPQIINGWADDYFGVMSARASLQGSAFKKAMREGREAGGWTPDQMKERQAELLANPTRDMLEEAERHAKEMTFTRDDGDIDKALQLGRRTLDDYAPGLPIGTAIMPFMRTPSNIISLGMRNSPLAPFSRRWWDDISAGGVRKEMALTQMAVGTGLYGVFMEMSMSGDLTGGGPGNRAQRQAMEREGFNGGVGWQPYSIRVGDRWYQYSRFEPLGQSMAIVGDFMEILANDDWDEASAEDGGEVAAHVIGSIGKAFFDKNMLAGAFDFFEAVRSGNGVKVENELGKRASAMVPFSGLARMARRGVDPYMRDTHDLLGDVRNGIPLLSDDEALQRDLWGKPRTYQSGLGTVYDAINLTKTRATGGNAIDFELQDQGISLTMPSRTFSINGMSVSLKNRPDIYSRFVELSGVAAYEHLEAVASGNHPDAAMYFSMTDGPAGEKAAYIKSVVDGYRKAAKEQVMEEYGADLMRMGDAKLKRLEGRAAE